MFFTLKKPLLWAIHFFFSYAPPRLGEVLLVSSFKLIKKVLN